MSYQRFAVYMLTCDRRPCLGPYPPYTEDFLPSYDGVRGARREARHVGWTQDGKLDICPACGGTSGS